MNGGASGSELWLLRLMVERGLRLLGASGLLIAMCDGAEVEVMAEAGAATPRVRSLPIQTSALGELCRTSASLSLERPSAREAPWLTELGLSASAVLVEPLSVEGQPGLVIALRAQEPGFDRADTAAASDFARSVSERIEAERSVERDRLRYGVLARERERARWAREIHDETVQGLAALRLRLADARRRGDIEELHTVIDMTLSDVDREIEGLRHLITALRPAALDDLGLVAALEALARRAGAIDGLTVETDISIEGAVPRLGPEVESAVYRITQEALTNVAKHSGATRVLLSLQVQGDKLVATVRDDGSGFSVADADTESDRGGTAVTGDGLPSGFGVVGMRERAELAGADLDIDSRPGQGTTVRVSVPVTGERTLAVG